MVDDDDSGGARDDDFPNILYFLSFKTMHAQLDYSTKLFLKVYTDMTGDKTVEIGKFY